MSTELQQISQLSAEKRLNYLLKEVNKNKQIWILTDDHGSVMLNSDDEDCIPVWPSSDFATLWATGEWSDCEAKAIVLDTWHQKWTDGLINDNVMIAAFPNPEEEGILLFPDEFEYELKNRHT